MPDPVGLRLDEEDRALLDACAAAERLSRSDILRRALRAYAKAIKVTPRPKRKGKK